MLVQDALTLCAVVLCTTVLVPYSVYVSINKEMRKRCHALKMLPKVVGLHGSGLLLLLL